MKIIVHVALVFLRKKETVLNPGFPAPKRPSFSSFPTTSWCGNWTENSGPFSALAAGPRMALASLLIRWVFEWDPGIHVRTGKKHIEKHDDVSICWHSFTYLEGCEAGSCFFSGLSQCDKSRRNHLES